MPARLCSRCGAPLTHDSPAQQILICHFCGAEESGEQAPPPRAPRVVSPVPQAPARPRWDISPELLREDESPREISRSGNFELMYAIAAVGVIAGLIAVVAAVVSSSSTHETSHSAAAGSAASTARAANTATSVLTPSTLATAPLTQWKTLRATPLDAPGIDGNYAAFDLLANFDWAGRIATTWSPDAKFYRLEARGHSTDGTFDLTPAGRRQDDVLLQYNSISKGDLDLTLELHYPRDASVNGAAAYVDASVSRHGDKTPRLPLVIPKCPLSRVLPLLRSTNKLARIEDGWSVGIAQDEHTTYWFVTYAVPGKMSVNGGATVSAEAFFNGATCAIEHPQ